MSISGQQDTQPEPFADTKSGHSLPFWIAPLIYLILACLFLWRSTFTGDVFLPAGLLGTIHPYSTVIRSANLPPWNPLRWDGIAQFYPWRHFAAETVRSGALPLWNPYQFCGTPFVANSQSAVFYPGNLLFYLYSTDRAFNLSAILHLTLCGWFTFLLLRRLGRSYAASLLGGIVYAFSAWQVAWLQLPTFLATSCWIPLLLRQVYIVGAKFSSQPLSRTLRAQLAIGCIVGLMLLAGHLQIAFYGLLAGTLLALTLLVVRGRRHGAPHALRMLGGYIAALALGLMLAAPQLLPTFELSRRSHRTGSPTTSGYTAYTEYALPPAHLVTLSLPDFFGNDSDPQNVYWGFYLKSVAGQSLALRHNAAETALYIGIVPLLLSGIALWKAMRRGDTDLRVVFFAGLALLALLLALGTPLNALFYFGIPGFGQSGSPARALVLWAFALAVLTSFGLDALRRRAPSTKEIAVAAFGLVLIFVVGMLLASQELAVQLQGFESLKVPAFGEALDRIGVDWVRLALMAAGGLALMLPIARRRVNLGGRSASILVAAALQLVLLDLFSVGIGSNPTASPGWVYPDTPGLKFVRNRIGHERIFPVNRYWSLYKPPSVVLPPNGAMVYGFRDVQGYDSLLTGQYKAFANRLAHPDANGNRDASPPEVGNMVFSQDPNAPLARFTGAALVITLPPDSEDFASSPPPTGAPLYTASDEMAVYGLPDALPRARFVGPDGKQTGNVVWIEDAPTRVSLNVQAPTEGLLVLADQAYPGWRVEADGQPLSLFANAPEAGGPFRAVRLPAGKHRVLFRYVPSSFRVGLYLAGLGWLAIASTLTALRSRRRRI